MITIHKYLVMPGHFTIEMPVRARVLTVQTQGSDAFLWAIVNDAHLKEKRAFVSIGTGHMIPDDAAVHVHPDNYVGTFQFPETRLVFHLFEVRA